MTLKNWLDYGWLRQHQATRQEIADLLAITDRDLSDAQAGGISTDWQFGIAYNAALKLCTILIHAEGYRVGQGLQHYRTIQALPLILGSSRDADATILIPAGQSATQWSTTALVQPAIQRLRS